MTGVRHSVSMHTGIMPGATAVPPPGRARQAPSILATEDASATAVTLVIRLAA